MVVAYRTKPDDPWTVHKCGLSGRINLDPYAACHKARWYVRKGAYEAQVMDGDQIYARFSKNAVGEVLQEGGCEL